MFPTLLAVKSTFTIAGKKIIKLAELSLSKEKNRSFEVSATNRKIIV